MLKSNKTFNTNILESNIIYKKKMVNYFARKIFSYDNDLLKRLVGHSQVIFFIDQNIPNNKKQELIKYCEKNKSFFIKKKIYSIDGTEHSKNIDNILNIITLLMKNNLNRKAIIVAIGGGSLMDSVGLAAQLYKRGIEYIRIPTTLLGIVDAAVGIKVGINHLGEKNVLGSFYPPKATISDVDFIKSLQPRQLQEGIAEILKISIVFNAKLFDELETLGSELTDPKIIEKDPYKYESFLYLSADALLKCLQKDFFEIDLQRHVDFGHAFAHTIESASKYTVSHGEAVSIDILLMANISLQRKLLSNYTFDRLISLYRKIGLPTFCPYITKKVLLQGIKSYKAHKGGQLFIVLPIEIGLTRIIHEISDHEISVAIDNLRKISRIT